MPQISCTTRFNTDAYSTWRSAFRECVKLQSKGDSESVDRLNKWLNPIADAEYSDQAKLGATHGVAYAKQHVDDVEALSRINDYKWLKEQYAIN
jgi:uncharacterized protein with beta-barrel porin domain